MTASAAGAMLAWMGGVMVGVGVGSQAILLTIGGAVVSALAIIYVRQFAES